jgi:Spy/CpxP family protein refolding chaperone
MRNKAIFVGLTLAVFFLGSSASFAQDLPDKPGPGGMRERLADFLELTSEQRARFDEIRKARQEEAKAFHEETGRLRPRLREAVKDPKADQEKIDSLIDQLSQARAAHLKNVVRSLRDMEKVLSPEQLEKFRDARSRMHARRGFDRGFGPRRRIHPGGELEGWF